MNIDTDILNLKTLSILEKNDKVSIKNNIITIDSNNLFQSLKRWWYDSNRDKGIIFIENFINDIKIKIIENSCNLENSIINDIRTHLFNSKDGLNNLKITYNNDVNINKKLDTILKNIDLILKIKI
uniref:Uncharacterized protein n=1 Tax=viral metagenome TaxID=1070528 RepID=A0A6C0IXT5_9ZZZZ